MRLFGQPPPTRFSRRAVPGFRLNTLPIARSAMLRLAAACLALSALLASPAAAVDRIVKRTGESVAGKIAEMGRDQVALDVTVGADQTVPANEIDYVEFDGQPPELRLARSAVEVGNIAQADEQLASSLQKAGDNRDLKLEIEFLQAQAAAAQAARDPQQAAGAIEKLRAFSTSGIKHYRYYPALRLLARTQVLAGKGFEARSTYQELAQSPFAEHKLAARVGEADAAMSDGEIDEAATLYDGVAGESAKQPGEVSQVLAAKLGQARVAVARKSYDQAIETLDGVIGETGPADTRVQAEAYVRRGDAFAAKGNAAKDAIMSYLHVDVVPALSKESELHAEALYRLKQMWPLVSENTRASQAADRLQSLYPNSEWAKK